MAKDAHTGMKLPSDGNYMQLFYDPIYHVNDGGKEIVDQALVIDTRILHQESNQFSNVGGYQSPTNPKNLEKFEPLFTYVEEHLNKFMDHLGCKRPALKYAGGGLWVNINGRGHYNKPHNHPETHFSGIYYVQVPEHSGALYFQRRQMQSFQIEALCGDRNPEYGPLFEVMPEKGDLFLFPSEMYHGVYPNFSRQDRISVSFNINIHGWAA